MRQRVLPIDKLQSWNEALSGIPHAFAHRADYCKAMVRDKNIPTFLFLYESDDGKAVCVYCEREKNGRKDIYTPYGWGGFVGKGSLEGLADAWHNFAAGEGYVCGYIGLHPALSRPGLFGEEDLFRSHSAYVLDLSPPLDELRKGLSRDHRSRLNAWAKSGGRLVSYQKALAEAFRRLYPDFAKRVGAGEVYHFSDETLAGLSILEGAYFTGAEDNGEITAVSLFLLNRDMAEYHLSAWKEGGERHSRAIIWAAIEYLKKKNVPALNLGAGVRDGDSLSDFKRRFGGRALDVLALKQVYDEGAFQDICAVRGVEASIEGYFPPYHAPEKLPPRPIMRSK